jgi:hypothetical protein
MAAGLQLVIAPERVIPTIASCDDATIDAAFARSSTTCVRPALRDISTTDNLKEVLWVAAPSRAEDPPLRLPLHTPRLNEKSTTETGKAETRDRSYARHSARVLEANIARDKENTADIRTAAKLASDNFRLRNLTGSAARSG